MKKGTSGKCILSESNIGVFEDNTLKFIIYSERKEDTHIGDLEPLENGNIRVWSGDLIPLPVADISIVEVAVTINPVAEFETFYGGLEILPNIYGEKISNARLMLFESGWNPEQPNPVEDSLMARREERFRSSGISEVSICSGTGYAFCSFKYKGAYADLRVTTVGEGLDPWVSRVDVKCY